MPQEAAKKTVLRTAMAAMAVSGVLALAKGTVWFTGGSAAMLASLTDSLIDLGVSASNFFVLRYAFQPADDDHRFGHGKAEGVAALAQAAFIAGSCAFLLLQTAHNIFTDAVPQGIEISIAVLAFSMVLTSALTYFQKRVARSSGSLATEADAAHYTGDNAVNLGVILSLLAGKYLGVTWLDPLTAILIALWLLFTARGIAAKAIDMLLDRELDENLRQDIMKIIRGTPGVEGLHDFRTRKSGLTINTSFDIEVDPTLTLESAHEISRVVEAGILARYPGAEVMIHIDPRGDITDSRHHKIREFHAR